MYFYKINGNSYYISAPTNIGIFQSEDKYALLVDRGDKNHQLENGKSITIIK